MKFSSTLEFNAVREWGEYYIHYEKLKSIIYDIERTSASQWRRVGMTDEEFPLMLDEPQLADMEQQFVSMLKSELEKVSSFYRKEELELLQELEAVEQELKSSEDGLSQPSSGGSSPRLPFIVREDLSTRARDLYINLCSLKDYVVLNYTGFAKALKKHDKVLGTHIKAEIMPAVDESYFWKQNSDSINGASLNDYIHRTALVYARIAFDGNVDRAITELGHYLREFVIWERNTIWRDMVGKERRITAAGVARVKEEPQKPAFTVRLPLMGSVAVSRSFFYFILFSAVFTVLIAIPVFEGQSKARCFAILIYASLLWAFEVLPLFVTSMLIPMLLVLFGVIQDDNKRRLPANAAAKVVFSNMLSPMIFLLLGGFSIAAALSKHQIAKRMATFMLSRAGTSSRSILLTVMFVATFASMWLSNVAAPVLCFSVVEPILRTLEPGNMFAKSMVMGIALASNIGGIVTPISSPQNAIALDNMSEISWMRWLAVTIPVSILANLLCWAMLLFVYNPSKATPRVTPIRASEEPLDRMQYSIIFISLLTILLWFLEPFMEDLVGSSGIVGILPMIIFFGTGILNKDDFNNFLWTVIMLAMGGSALGFGVKNSELLQDIASAIQRGLEGHGAWTALVVFSVLVLFAATFVSHTVSAIIILPLVKEVGGKLPGDHANILVMGAALMCSGAMGLPVSGFPNITAVSMEDSAGRPFVKTLDFLKVGIPMSVVMAVLVVTIGYGLMYLVGV